MFAMDRSRLISAFLFTKQLTNYTACFLTMVALVLGPCQAIAAESPEPSAEPRAPVPLQMAVMSLPDGQVQSAYHAMLAAEGGAKPYRWSVSDALPAGLALDAATGDLTGTPATPGNYGFTVKVTSSSLFAEPATKRFSIAVAAAPAPFAPPINLPVQPDSATLPALELPASPDNATAESS